MSIVLTNPEEFPEADSFREGVIEAANYYYVHMAEMEDVETRTRLVMDVIMAFDLVIAVLQATPDEYTFFTVKGAHVLHTAMTTDKPAPFTMAGFPIFYPEDADRMRAFYGDGANLQ